jgi:formylmethanofuran dehydrogenase subunit E
MDDMEDQFLATLKDTSCGPELAGLLEASAALHHHLCPRQVLGVRMGLYAGELLGLAVPQADKRLLTIVETDGCASDGIAVATNCWVGRRTLRIEDYGKVAATFVDTDSGRAVRVVPRPKARCQAAAFAPGAANTWEAQLLGYQRMPAAQLLAAQGVRLRTPIEQIVSRPGRKTICEACGEEILNEREIVSAGRTLCRACAGQCYYDPCDEQMAETHAVCVAVG